jgi:hypothetical protein
MIYNDSLAGTHDYTQSMKMYILHIESYLMLVFVLHNQYAISCQSMASQTGQERPYSRYLMDVILRIHFLVNKSFDFLV